ncbi:MAG: SDR family NAD(P)-dependent oxidoreductase [Nitrososphaerales archaeon]
MKTGELEGKYALITGASRGLGQALSVDFAREGAAGLALVSRSGRVPRSQGRRDDIEIGTKTKILPIVADLGRPEEIERIVALTLNEFNGELDVLVNNASALGPTPMPLLVDYPLNDFRKVLDTNLIAPFLLIKKLLPALRESNGSIVNVTSDAGRHGYPGWGAYGISKFGLEGLSQTLAAELKDEVRVNVVDPGDMNTAMHRAAEPHEDPSQWADPADLTKVFIYLASDESRGVTGRRFLAQSKKWNQHRVARQEAAR